MAMFHVVVARTVIQTADIFTQAETAEEAEQIALDKADSDPDLNWYVNDVIDDFAAALSAPNDTLYLNGKKVLEQKDDGTLLIVVQITVTEEKP